MNINRESERQVGLDIIEELFGCGVKYVVVLDGKGKEIIEMDLDFFEKYC